jgi:hypothetical protein
VHFAKSTLWITAAVVLATFEFAKLKDEDGEDIEFVAKFTDGLVR